ncbi:MAG: SDR family NAD(P)-dependent oxidoreductase [Oligoflexia bacterium]|nr:SDR family NAD(P)-dependent oxidoreductase [Oligoflexia bacterium]
MKKIFITGASSGIGLELAKAYLSQGNIVGVCSRNLSHLSTAWIKIYQILPNNLFLYEADVTDRERIVSVITQFATENGGLDILVANAGTMITDKKRIPDFTNVREVLNTNIMGTINTFEAGLKIMLADLANKDDGNHGHCDRNGRSSHSGNLVAIASVAGMVGLPHTAAYSASKAAVLKWCESFAIDLRPLGIVVTAIAPGFVDTPFIRFNRHYMPFIMSPEKAARLIIKAVEKNKELYIFPLRMNIVMTLLYHLPRFLYRWLMRLVRFY